ncbi:uncharacterized protein LOC128557051 [Mercenaria mercenaria]|uniref:uncharacterized protein LOC128557051 n=1 Tax=Mercenaria mercenaria TaxID=6596 RepID=UPI00234E90BB|nr:uncharacterized protein LOC128557051 [Mercenaria mercenaria]
MFDGCERSKDFLDRWNYEAATSNSAYPPTLTRAKTVTKPDVPMMLRNRPQKCEIVLIETDTKFYLSTDSVKLFGGGNDAPMFTKTDRKLTHHEAADILHQNIKDSITYDPPYRPESGSVFLYDDSGDVTKKEDWRADGYTWKNNGRRVYKTEGKDIERTFFKIRNQGIDSDGFQKHVFRFTDSDYNGKTVIVYYGDSVAYKELPHGNRKKNSRPYKRTKPSVIKDIKRRGVDEKPKQLIDKMKCEESLNTKIEGVNVPRNTKQIKNIQSNIRKEAKLSHDNDTIMAPIVASCFQTKHHKTL